MRLLVAAAVLLLNGCSFLFVNPAPKTVTAYSSINCTTSRAAPAVDTALTVIQGVGTAVYAQSSEARSEVLIGGLLWAGVYSLSAIYGWGEISSCQEKTEEHDRLFESEERNKNKRPD
jgi:hypothetical protein